MLGRYLIQIRILKMKMKKKNSNIVIVIIKCNIIDKKDEKKVNFNYVNTH